MKLQYNSFFIICKVSNYANQALCSHKHVVKTRTYQTLFPRFLSIHSNTNQCEKASKNQKSHLFQEEGNSWVTTEPYANDGATISASSSVVFTDEQMLIGSSFGRLLHCDLTHSYIT